MGRWLLATPVRTFAAAMLILLAFAAYSQFLRSAYIPDVFRWIPKEAPIVVATGDLGAVWNAIENHFGVVLDDEDREGVIAEALDDLQEDLLEKEIVIESLDDVRHYGIDTSRGLAAAAFQADGDDLEIVAVVPIRSRAAFGATMERLMDDETESKECLLDDKPFVKAVAVDSAIIHYPFEDVALLATSCETLVRALLSQAANLRHARSHQRLYHAARFHLGRPLLLGPGAVVFFDAANAGLPVREAVLSVDLQESEIRTLLSIGLLEDNSRLVEELLARPPPEASGRELLDPRSPAVVVLRDVGLRSYLRFASTNDEILELLETSFGGLFAPLEEEGSISQIAQAVVSFRELVPGLILGIWADDALLDSATSRAQVRLRKRRDRGLLEAALAAAGKKENGEEETGAENMVKSAGEEEEPGTHPVWSVEDLYRLEFLEPERSALFERYPIEDGVPGEAGFGTKSLDREQYERIYAGERIRYLAPPVTDNDLRYRLSPEDVAQLMPDELEELKGNRRRLASWRADGVLWVATDERDVEAFIDRSSGPRAAGQETAVQLARPDAGDKVFAIADIEAMIEDGILSDSADVSDAIVDFLLDFRKHDVMEGRIEVDALARSIRVSLEIRR